MIEPITFQQITEFYSRDTSVPADDDIAELTYLLNEEKIFIKHHLQVIVEILSS